MEDKKKKILIPTIIAAFVLVVLVVGATYAYFSVETHSDFGTKTITARADEVGSVALSSGTKLSMKLTAADMVDSGKDVTYYASSNGKTTTPTTENIGVATVIGNGDYTCSYSLTMDDNETSLYDAFQGMSKKSNGQIVLTLNGTEYDFNTSGLFPKTISGTMSGLTSTNPGFIQASLKLINKTGVNQSALAGSSLSITFTVESFECEAEEKVELAGLNIGEYILDNPTTGLTTTSLQGGMYRYQGETSDNYVCFGTSDQNECINNPGLYMYRILGITESGQLYLLKKEALEDVYEWHENNSEFVSWPESDLFKRLNGTYVNSNGELEPAFVNNSAYPYMAEGNSWYYKIELYDWKYGEKETGYTSLSPIEEYEEEIKFTNSIEAKVGLQYTSDILYAFILEEPTKSNVGGWANLYLNDSNFPISQFGYNITKMDTDEGVEITNDIAVPAEWGMNYTYGESYNIMEVDMLGYTLIYRGYLPISADEWNNYIFADQNHYVSKVELPVRPVFYLKNNVQYVSGNGTSSDPFIIN